MLVEGEFVQAQTKRGKRTIDQREVPTLTKQFHTACILEVEAGTNGAFGGDSGHGSRTYLRFKDLGSFDIRAKASVDGKELQIVFGGDFELQEIQSALLFAAEAIGTLNNEAVAARKTAAQLRAVFAKKFPDYFMKADDEESIKFWASESTIDPARFEAWIDTCKECGWRQLANGGAGLLFGSFDDEFDVLKAN
jgi:hypothetical protein